MEEKAAGTDHEKQIEGVFNELWVGRGDNYEDDRLRQDTLDRYNSWSDGKVSSNVQSHFDKQGPSPLKILDCGCGLGFSFNSIFSAYKDRIEYTGLDLIDLKRTEAFLSPRGYNFKLIRASMVDIPAEIPREQYDIVTAIGTLMCTESTQNALSSTYSMLKPGGLFIGWIINDQKPVRVATDEYYRDYFDKVQSDEGVYEEIMALSKFSMSLGEALGDQKVVVSDDVDVLGLAAGEYNIQTLIYDYIIKLYYVKGHSLERTYDQLFDWFMPKWYHQTSRAELEEMLNSLKPTSWDIETRTNGHFFFIHK
jgi:ubiquinone/menaquinone biosynthesis C-methylase UbiE